MSARFTGLHARLRRALRLTNVRILSQLFFFGAFLLAVWATWTSRLGGYPVSRILEMDPLVLLSTALATGFVYRALGWGLAILVVTLLFGRVFCNWICPYGTLHQFVGWLFNVRNAPERWESNRYRSIYTLKYGILAVFLILAALGALQIGLLDPICLMYRTVSTVFSPAIDMALDALSERLPVAAPLADAVKFAPGVDPRVFVGSLWIGVFLTGLVAMNLLIPRFFCRVLCPLGALLGRFRGSRCGASTATSQVHRLRPVPEPLRRRVRSAGAAAARASASSASTASTTAPRTR